METQKQSDQIRLGLLLFGIYGGILLAFVWEPSSSIRASIVFCLALGFIPLLIWQLVQSQTNILQQATRLRTSSISVVGVVALIVIGVLVFDVSTSKRLALVFIGFMIVAGMLAWQTVQYSLINTLPAWLASGLVTGLLTSWISDLSQEEMVKQSALIIVFSLIMGVAAMTGQLEAGINSILSTEPPSEGESAIH